MSYNSYTIFQLLPYKFLQYKCIPELCQLIWAGGSIITSLFDNVRHSSGNIFHRISVICSITSFLHLSRYPKSIR
jgi:hypothetical protein